MTIPLNDNSFFWQKKKDYNNSVAYTDMVLFNIKWDILKYIRSAGIVHKYIYLAYCSIRVLYLKL